MARRRQAVTIKHVAADAGVSLQTVSRVINKEPNVRPHMAERVREAIDRLGYVPSIAAQRMSGSRSYLILALNDRERTIADWRERQGADWVDQMMLGGMVKAAEHGYRLIIELVDTHSDHIDRELAAALAALRPDGVILTPPHSENPTILRRLEDEHISVARIGSLRPGYGFALTMDDERAARIATEHLLGLGHRRVGFIAGPEAYELSQWRILGWQQAMAAAKTGSDGLMARGDFGYDSGIVATRHLLDRDQPPSAIIASSDRMALAVLEVARQRGLSVPDDLSVISFDDTPIVRFTHPPLTAVVQPIAEVASRAVERIINACAGRDSDLAPEIIPASLAVRASTGPPRSG
ncbi:LacI family DNA-binding transcriptional regulator [Sphingomonas sp. 37zxx]|uniref:LacI family DNA-binding transcriptional regulator n=1 Tax=Sphingomonas sp. 37zxx TaxID=1550073 RepID=UPI00053BF5CA|nr:LacI family DNA-binding transcriptional regulator [Sphingomonas sp. 37zxx]